MTKRAIGFISILLLVLAFLTPLFAVETDEKTTPIYQEVFSSPDYMVTTGDVYTLTYNAMNTVVKYVIVVDPTYKVRVSNLGIIDAKGKTFFELKKEVEDIVTANYPMSAVQLVLSSPSTFKITVAGEVGTVHEQRVSGLVRLSSVVSGNANSNTSQRFVTVEDEDGNVNSYDLFQAQRFGDMSQDPFVRPNDTVILQPYQRRVSISGSVRRGGTYELLEGENLKALIDYYGGGFSILADTENIILSRNLSDFAKSGQVVYLNEKDYNNNLALLNLDSIYVGSKADLQRTVFVQGAINSGATAGAMLTQSAAFRFEEGETYAHFARAHRGMFSDAADFSAAYVYRDGESISIDLYSMVFDPEYESSLTLQADDILVIPFRQFFVTVAGAVTSPGRYPYIPDRKWDYYMALAGGYNTSINNPDTIEITTLEGKTLSTDDFILPETTITAPAMLRVMISGEVTAHQELTLTSSLTRLSSVVSSHKTAYSSDRFVTVKDRNGNVKRYDFFLMNRFGDLSQNPYVKDGDTITVERAERKVSIHGAVEKPGTYELKYGENLKTLVEYYAGGLDPLANTSNITLSRRLSDFDKAGEILYLDEAVLQNDYILVNRDSVTIGSATELRNTIFVQGAVNVQIGEATQGATPTNNISYQFETGETYLKFIKSHRGWFTDVSDYERSYISRNGQKIGIDLYSILFDPEYENNLKLEAGDVLTVPFKQFFVTVAGAVGAPGRYPYIPDRKWDYYVALAGGYNTSINNPDTIEIVTLEGKKLSTDDYILPETTITAPSMLRVMISGEVTRHQEITLGSSLTRLSSVVSSYRTPYSSSRFVSVKDRNGNVKNYDFFLMDRFGDLSQDPYVKDGDTIIVDRSGRKVSISGAVERPGTYELKYGENLKTLVLYYAGGLDPLANTSNITLTRLLSKDEKAGEVQYLDKSVLLYDFELVNRDSITIGNNRDLRDTIFIQGAVNVQIAQSVTGEVPTNNIRYQFEPGETYLKLVRSHKDWFTDVSDYNRSYVSRRGERLPIDLYSMLFNPEYENNLRLEADDILVVPFKQFFVTVSGAVKVPGRYAYVPDRTWEYYVGLAGGFDPDLNTGDKITMTTNEGSKLVKTDFVLPETTIDAARNSFTYNFNKYVTPITTILSLITSSVLLYNYFSNL